MDEMIVYADIKTGSPIPKTFQELKSCDIKIAPRSTLEGSGAKGLNNLQIIPYIILHDRAGKILSYRRVKGTGEQRLLGKKSIGFGGHMNIDDLKDITLEEAIHICVLRELQEELSYKPTRDIRISDSFLIYDPSNEVGLDHIGIPIYIQVVATEKQFTTEESISSLEFINLDTLTGSEIFEYENWSQILMVHNIIFENNEGSTITGRLAPVLINQKRG